MSEIRTHLEQLEKLIGGTPEGYATTPRRFMLEHGREFKTGPNTYAGRRGTPKQCFMNAGRLAIDDPTLTYVEGYVTCHGVPLEHAWLIDKDGLVVDPTLKVKPGEDRIGEYFGVPISTKALLDQIFNRTKVWGVLDPMTNMNLYKEGIPDGFVKEI